MSDEVTDAGQVTDCSQVRILTPEEMEADRLRREEKVARFGGNIRCGGRKKAPATIIREMMEGEFANVTEKNMSQIAAKLMEMVNGEDGNDRRFAIKTLIDAQNKIIDRQVEEELKKQDVGGQLVVNVNRGSVVVSKGKDSVKIDMSTSEDALREREKEIKSYVKSLDEPPEDLVDAFGYEMACDMWAEEKELENVEVSYELQKEEKEG